MNGKGIDRGPVIVLESSQFPGPRTIHLRERTTDKKTANVAGPHREVDDAAVLLGNISHGPGRHRPTVAVAENVVVHDRTIVGKEIGHDPATIGKEEVEVGHSRRI